MESQSPKSTKRYSHLLIRLGEDELARSIYLQSRTAYIRKKIRAMQALRAYSTNEVDAFVEGIAWLTIRVIKNSWSIYSEVFSETKMASSFMEWVKEQVEGIFPPMVLLIALYLPRYFDDNCLGILLNRNCIFAAKRVLEEFGMS